jgi:hypothetical protein
MAGSQAMAGLRSGVSKQRHSDSELTRLGSAMARWPGPQHGEWGGGGRGAHQGSGCDVEAAVKGSMEGDAERSR